MLEEICWGPESVMHSEVLILVSEQDRTPSLPGGEIKLRFFNAETQRPEGAKKISKSRECSYSRRRDFCSPSEKQKFIKAPRRPPNSKFKIYNLKFPATYVPYCMPLSLSYVVYVVRRLKFGV